ncbi:MAG: 2-succinyl-5-enolpyruvyl-6-hydroxy-3-cyclohexene-1-carboxylic-acid synthase [Betaproteobacteria bacterium]|nr:2-succinyl-5-enolpyruvyl-6-hydroxy-3-cyclohexene-1-carboxylic-acid synthase [Betaproteobacteria bacterium]
MNAAPDDLHSAWAQLFAAALAQCGVAHAVISPGSRSTPLALALAAQLPCTVLHDERVAAFFALGQARASGRPSVVLATSGTAPGHWLPAAMEAREAGLPLLLLSADRPWEVQQAQASQTVDQVRLFGHHAHAFFELGLPDAHPAALRAVTRIAAQAVLATRYPLAGAVQVNAHFRKPLEPQPSDGREPWRTQWQALRDAGAPRLLPPRPTPDPQAVAALVAAVRAAPRGVVVAGPAPAPRAAAWRAAVQRFVAASGYVLLAEATSQLRFGLDIAARPRCIGAFDALLRSPALRRRLRPQLALEIGAPAVSAQWLAWCSGDDAPARWVLPGERPADPAGGALGMVLGPVAALLDAAAAALETQPGPAAAAADATTYAAAWRAAEDAAWQARSQAVALVSRHADGDTDADADAHDDTGLLAGAAAHGATAASLQEHEVAPLLRAALPPGAVLAIGNSSPVRDLDHDLPPDAQALTLLHQRGAAGIDGAVAGAAGARSVLDAPMALLLGDVALLHDAGGLAAAAAVRGPLAIVVVHNDGGRIFERLPLGRDISLAGACDRLFVVPHGHGFDGLAATWGLTFARVDQAAALAQALAQALAADRPILIEARVAPGGSARRTGLLAAMAHAAEAAVGA